jgi:hypothetical protein
VPSRSGALGSEAALAGEDRLLLLQEGREVEIRDLIDQVIELTAVLNRRADRLMKGRGDINANPSVTAAGMKVESGMLLSGLAAAVGLAAGAVLEDQSAAEQGLIGEELNGAGARVALLG